MTWRKQTRELPGHCLQCTNCVPQCAQDFSILQAPHLHLLSSTYPTALRRVAAVPQGSEAKADQGNAPIPQTVPVGQRVLVVEDEALVAMQVEDAIKRLTGTMIGPAASVEEALRLIEADAIDAALLDVNLTGQRSDEVALALIAAGVPFAVCTGYAEDIDLPASMEGKMRLSKPVEPGQLTSALVSLLTDGE